MVSLFKVYLWSQVVSPFYRVDMDVLLVSSSLVCLAPHAVADGPKDSDKRNHEAEHNHDVGRDHPPRVPVIFPQRHQVDPGAGQRKSHTRQDHTGHGPQLLRHIHHHLTHLLLLYLSFQLPFSLFCCPLM